MTEITLKDFLKDRDQAEAAAFFGCTQSAVSQMLSAGRDIRIVLNAKGAPVSHYEIKKPKKRKAA